MQTHETNNNESETTIARRYSVAQSTVSKINKLLTQFLLSNEKEKTNSNQKEQEKQKEKQQNQAVERLSKLLRDKTRGGDRESRARRRKLGA